MNNISRGDIISCYGVFRCSVGKKICRAPLALASTTNLNGSQRIYLDNSLVFQRAIGIIRCEYFKFVVLM